MEQGFNPRLLFTKTGNLMAFTTGSDACAEHEIGSNRLQRRLTAATHSLDEWADLYRHNATVQIQPLLERKRIAAEKAKEHIEFITHEGTEETAMLFSTERGNVPTLSFPSFKSELRDPDIAAAWDERDFAIKVRGKKYCKALRQMYEAMLNGDAYFGGTFLQARGSLQLEGLVFVNYRYLDDESKSKVKSAQEDFIANIQLKARGNIIQLYADMRQECHKHDIPGFLWETRFDSETGDVLYSINPRVGVTQNHYGPYRRQELLDWAATGYKAPLGTVERLQDCPA
ncbi:hypothetical protein LC612_36825 [Nostoc sp. CHAB 5834]|nr:hypothetical protein [Nostoc sp. CHAB 5834]